MENVISYWKVYSRPQKYSTLTCKWQLIALNQFLNQCALKSTIHFRQKAWNFGRHSMDVAEGAVSNFVCANLAQLPPWMPCSTLHSWSFWKHKVLPHALVFSFPFTLPPLWAALCVFDTWGSKERENRENGVWGSYLELFCSLAFFLIVPEQPSKLWNGEERW